MFDATFAPALWPCWASLADYCGSAASTADSTSPASTTRRNAMHENKGTGQRVALYARVSTKNNGQDPETQLIALREYAGHRGMTVTDEYVDIGISGAKDRRPELDRLMVDARRRRFDVVLVARFDRFARSTK